MSDQEINLKITGQSDTGPASQETIANLKAIKDSVDQVRDTMMGLAEGMASAFHEVKEASAGAGHGTEELGKAMREGSMMGELLAEGVKKLSEMVVELGHHVWETAVHFAEFSDHLHNVSRTSGQSVADLQHLNSMALLTGVSFDAFQGATNRLQMAYSRAQQGVRTYTQDFRQMHIEVSGHLPTQELLNRAMEAFAGMEAGPERTAMAMRIFGRSVNELGPLLNMSEEELHHLNEQIERFGGDVAPRATAAGVHIAEALDEQKLAWHNMTGVMMEAVGPALDAAIQGFNDMLASFLQWVRHSPEGEAALNAIRGGLLDFVEALKRIPTVYMDFMSYQMIFWRNMQAGWAIFVLEVGVQLNNMAIGFQTLGQVMFDALTYNMAGAVEAVERGNQRIADSTNAAIATIGVLRAVQAVGNARDETAIATRDTLSILREGMDRARALNQNGIGSGGGGTPVRPQSGAGGGHGGQSQMQEFQNELREQELRQHRETGDWLADMTQFEIRFWEEKLAHARSGSQEYRQIESQLMGLRLRDGQTRLRDQLQENQDEIGLNRDLYKVQERLLEERTRMIGAAYGADSREYRRALADQKAAAVAHAEEMRRLQVESQRFKAERDLAAARFQMQMSELTLSQEHQADAVRVGLGMVTARQAIEMDRQVAEARERIRQTAADAEHAAAAAALDDEIRGLETAQRRDEQAITEALRRRAVLEENYRNQQKLAEKTFQNQLSQLRLQEINATAQVWRQRVQALTSTWGQAVHGLIAGTTSWRDALISVADTLLGEVISAMERMLQRQIMNLMFSKALRQADGKSQIHMDAAQAASGAYKAMVGIPVVGPVLAPAAAAVAYGGVMAFEGMLGSAEGGWLEVPGTVGAQLHKKEMVLPEWAAEPLRGMLGAASGRSGGGAPAMGGGRPVNIHIHAMDAKSVERLFRTNKGALGSALRAQLQRELVNG